MTIAALSRRACGKWLLFVFLPALCCSAADRRSPPTRIVLDPTTFPKISRPLLQETADQVAKAVDELIPGGYPHTSSSSILCFVANGTWKDMPRALVGNPWKMEPTNAKKYGMRVALTPNVLPGAWQRLVFQLSHELTHLKMDARVDNNAMETFATAVSLEALQRLGYDPYREDNERYYTQALPPEVLAALNRNEWEKVGLYLRYKWRNESDEHWDRATHFLAAIALRRMGGFPWERLFNIGASAQCGSFHPRQGGRYCPFSPPSLEGFPKAMKSLLLKDEINIALMRAEKTRLDQPESLEFSEEGKWISLRWGRKTDALLPEGYAPVE